jgi:hypothetical protein
MFGSRLPGQSRTQTILDAISMSHTIMWAVKGMEELLWRRVACLALTPRTCRARGMASQGSVTSVQCEGSDELCFSRSSVPEPGGRVTEREDVHPETLTGNV